MIESQGWLNPPNVIKVDWVNYTLQTGAGSNVAVMNAEELVDQMNEVSALCAKSRSSLPPKVLKSLTVPFDGEALTPVIRPGTLAVTSVPRQHILSCALNKKGKKGASMFETPPEALALLRHSKRKKSHGEAPPAKRRKELASMTSDEFEGPSPDELPRFDAEVEGESDDDIQAVLRQSRAALAGQTASVSVEVSVLKAAVDFLDDFADEGEPDRATAKRLALWMNMKLGKFRGLIVSDGLHAAAQVQSEFTLRDSLLAELLYDLQKDKVEALKALVESKQTTSASTVRQSGNTKPVSKVPKNVSRTLPKQGSMQLCLRAHFRPATLSKEAKDHITTHFGGLAPEFADL
ncbi:hypothetical protein PHPALM_31842 [Phytophthora palmivora]|uniref:Uncharacterized protein n=1 Tax=Phytophthora palmivora TaxID=4796 RepID=A0A2P4X1L7_9STRA|nr:hypothetical protein PHPALM_31842 [Phytophthora palmivora]